LQPIAFFVIFDNKTVTAFVFKRHCSASHASS